ncbi:MAG: transcriptional repressor NrdR [Phycisphaerales bacterium]|nr:transcriptional repressor NrdR [Phycisphaerales bacterium]
MNCPHCKIPDARVIDSRPIESGQGIRRRRECLVCKKRFTSYERAERLTRIKVIKKDGSRVPFDSVKILRGIQSACGKRPVPEAIKQKITDEIDDGIHRDFEHEVPSAEIGRRVAVALRNVDPVAFVRFASVYHDFQSVAEFQLEIAHLAEKPPTPPDHPSLFEDK